MFISFRPAIQTSLFLLLFIGAAKCFVLAGTVDRSIIDDPISFNITPEIQYLSLRHFQNNDSRIAFEDARKKEAELAETAAKTDSLRKIYSKAPLVERETIAEQILKNEEKSIGLNQEIAQLYQFAHEKEDQFWREQSPDKRKEFQRMIVAYSDSVVKARQLSEYQKSANVKIDTALFLSASTQKQAPVEAQTNAVIYKIQIGAYKGKLPETPAKMIKKLSMLRKVDTYLDEKGFTIYSTGNLKTHQEAVTLQSQVKQEGVKNPIVTAYYQGKKITVEEAKKINKEL